jgi:UDP-GlcNAc:undecaprenyl-phosphate GlcNAc-1-phosphate transferase
MLWLMLTALGGPCLLAIAMTMLVRAWALRRGFVDKPGGHKQHDTPIALGGGIAIVVAIALPVLAGCFAAQLLAAHPPGWLPAVIARHIDGISSKLPVAVAIIGGALILHVTGLIDDHRPLGPGVKFTVQFAVAIVIAGPVGIRAVELLPAPVSIAVTVLWIVLITNAFNFLDNMDGLSAGVGAVAMVVFSVAALRAGQVFVPVMGLTVAGALAGFLIFNFAPARIFMGDAGSLVVGYLIGVLTILTTFHDPQRNLTPLGIFVPIIALAVPLYDVTSVVIHRIRLGISPLRGDRRHFSHRLVRRGMSTRGAVLTIYLATAATGLPAIVLPSVTWTSAALLLVQCLCVVVMIALLEHAGIGSEDLR